MPVFPWVALGGSSRRYHNPETGETISREKYERLYGSLAKRGAKSFKEAAKRTPPEIRALRPSKAPSYARKAASGPEKFSGLRPLAGRQSRSVQIPFHAFWDGDIAAFATDAEPYRHYYVDAIKRIQSNSKIRSLQVFYSFQNFLTYQSGVRPATEGWDKYSAPTFDDVVSGIIDKLESRTNIEIDALEIRVMFFREFLTQPTRRRGLRLQPKRKR
jgi:hypothetical protein